MTSEIDLLSKIHMLPTMSDMFLIRDKSLYKGKSRGHCLDYIDDYCDQVINEHTTSILEMLGYGSILFRAWNIIVISAITTDMGIPGYIYSTDIPKRVRRRLESLGHN